MIDQSACLGLFLLSAGTCLYTLLLSQRINALQQQKQHLTTSLAAMGAMLAQIKTRVELKTGDARSSRDLISLLHEAEVTSARLQKLVYTSEAIYQDVIRETKISPQSIKIIG